MQIIKERERKTEIKYTRDFQNKKENHTCGFSFPCNKDGDVILDNIAAEENYLYALNHPELFDDYGIVKNENTYTEPAIGICDCCGKEVWLYGFTNECECGELYNSFGQHLKPMKYWGEDW